MKLIKFQIAKTFCGYGLPLIAAHVVGNIYCITDQLRNAIGVPSPFFALDDLDKTKDTYNVRRTQFFKEVPEFANRIGSVRGTGCSIYAGLKVLAEKSFNVTAELSLITHPFLYVAEVNVEGYGLRHSALQNKGVVMLTAQDLYAEQCGLFKPTVFYIKSPESLQLFVENENFVQQTPIKCLHAGWNNSVMALLLNTVLFPNKSVASGIKDKEYFDYNEDFVAWKDFERSYFEVRNRYG